MKATKSAAKRPRRGANARWDWSRGDMEALHTNPAPSRSAIWDKRLRDRMGGGARKVPTHPVAPQAEKSGSVAEAAGGTKPKEPTQLRMPS